MLQPNMKGKKILAPPHRRKSGRPRDKRIRSYDEPRAEKKLRKCGKCKQMTGHNSRTCGGAPVGSNPTTKRARTECDAETFTFTTTHPETSRARGAAKSNQKKQKSSFVGESSTAPAQTPSFSTPSTFAATPSSANISHCNFVGVGSVALNIQQPKAPSKTLASKKPKK